MAPRKTTRSTRNVATEATTEATPVATTVQQDATNVIAPNSSPAAAAAPPTVRRRYSDHTEYLAAHALREFHQGEEQVMKERHQEQISRLQGQIAAASQRLALALIEEYEGTDVAAFPGLKHKLRRERRTVKCLFGLVIVVFVFMVLHQVMLTPTAAAMNRTVTVVWEKIWAVAGPP